MIEEAGEGVGEIGQVIASDDRVADTTTIFGEAAREFPARTPVNNGR
jgi:hypothetical protein